MTASLRSFCVLSVVFCKTLRSKNRKPVSRKRDGFWLEFRNVKYMLQLDVQLVFICIRRRSHADSAKLVFLFVTDYEERGVYLCK
jgi:hypothetical protein